MMIKNNMKNIGILYINLGKELGNLENLRDEISNKLKSKDFIALQAMVAKSNLVSQLNKVKHLMNELDISVDKIDFEEYDELLQELKNRGTIY